MVEKRNATNRLRLGLYFEIAAGVCGVLILIRAVLFLRDGYKPTEISASKKARSRKQQGVGSTSLAR
jgi:hypothetical protein